MTTGNDETITRDGPPIKVDRVQLETKAEQAEAQAVQDHTLTTLSAHFEFFTPGVLYAGSSFDRDAVAEFNWQYPAEPDQQPFMIESAMPYFRGLGVRAMCGGLVDFDRRLYGIAKARWPFLRDTLGGIVMYDPRKNFYARVAYHTVTIVDTEKLQRMAIVTELPAVQVTVFGVDTAEAFWHLQPATYPALPFLKRAPPLGGISNRIDTRYGIPVPTQLQPALPTTQSPSS